jgi:long-chain-fatty-acid---luciferin-component ligase
MNFRESLIKEGVNIIGHVISDSANMFYYPQEEQEKLRFQAIKKAFEFHYNYNDFYKTLCEQSGNFKPSDLQVYSDLQHIPLIPIEFFREGKTEHMLTIPAEYKQLELHAEGVAGSESITYRDSYTSEYCINGLNAMFLELLDMRQIKIPSGVFLTPSVRDTPELGILRALVPLNVFFCDQVYAVKGKEFKFEEAAKFIKGNGN